MEPRAFKVEKTDVSLATGGLCKPIIQSGKYYLVII